METESKSQGRVLRFLFFTAASKDNKDKIAVSNIVECMCTAYCQQNKYRKVAVPSKTAPLFLLEQH